VIEFRSMRLISTVVGCVLLLSLAGCGSIGDREQAAAATALRLLTAVRSGDGDTACAVLAPDTAADVEQGADASCPDAILREDLPEPGVVVGTEVFGQWAQVRTSTDTLFLAVFRPGWRVVAAGCTPQGDRPYDCVVQGG
jgi:hypothetical protein